MISVKAYYTSKGIEPASEDGDKLQYFKKQLNEGDAVEITFKKWQEARSDRAFRYFHAIMNRYADELGLSQVWAKHELCINFGVAVEYDDKFEPPSWPGHFVEYHDKIFFRKSTKNYTTREMAHLIDMSLTTLEENGIDIEDLKIEYKDYYAGKVKENSTTESN
jgi:hypothetical protein